MSWTATCRHADVENASTYLEVTRKKNRSNNRTTDKWLTRRKEFERKNLTDGMIYDLLASAHARDWGITERQSCPPPHFSCRSTNKYVTHVDRLSCCCTFNIASASSSDVPLAKLRKFAFFNFAVVTDEEARQTTRPWWARHRQERLHWITMVSWFYVRFDDLLHRCFLCMYDHFSEPPSTLASVV